MWWVETPPGPAQFSATEGPDRGLISGGLKDQTADLIFQSKAWDKPADEIKATKINQSGQNLQLSPLELWT